MEKNKIFQETPAVTTGTTSPSGKKPLEVTGLVLGIVALVASPFIPLASYICGIIGLIFAIKNWKTKRATAALILCILGIACGIASNVYTYLVLMPKIQAMLQ